MLKRKSILSGMPSQARAELVEPAVVWCRRSTARCASPRLLKIYCSVRASPSASPCPASWSFKLSSVLTRRLLVCFRTTAILALCDWQMLRPYRLQAHFIGICQCSNS